MALPRCRARMTSFVCGRASNFAAVPGRLRVRHPSARCLTGRAARPQPRAARQSVLNAPRPAAWPAERRDIALSPAGDSAAFSSLVLVDSQFGFSPASGPSQLATTALPVPLSVVPCNSVLFTSGRTFQLDGGPYTKGDSRAACIAEGCKIAFIRDVEVLGRPEGSTAHIGAERAKES